jgi:uncharacterized protein DUF6152
MKGRLATCCVLCAGILSVSGRALAHHGSRVSYDLTSTVTLKGILKEINYSNPHVYFTFDVKDDKGHVTEWAAETDPPIMMERRYGWSKRYLKPGDEVTDRTPRRLASLEGQLRPRHEISPSIRMTCPASGGGTAPEASIHRSARQRPR